MAQMLCGVLLELAWVVDLIGISVAAVILRELADLQQCNPDLIRSGTHKVFDMATGAAQSLIGGFNAGTNARMADTSQQALQLKQQQEIRKNFDESIKSTIAEMQTQATNIAPQLYQGNPQQRADAQKALDETYKLLSKSTAQMLSHPLSPYNDAEKANFIGMLDLARKTSDPQFLAKQEASAAELKAEKTRLGTESAIASEVSQRNLDAENQRAMNLKTVPTTQNINNRELGTKAVNTVQDKLISIKERLVRLNAIQNRFKPEYLQVPTRLKAAILEGYEKYGGEISEKDKTFVNEITAFYGDALVNINNTIREMTGAQMSIYEADRLRMPEPDPGESPLKGQSPTRFKSNLDRAILNATMAQARMNKLLSEGFITEEELAASSRDNPIAGNKAETLLSLDQMVERYDARGEEIFDQIKGDNPGISDDEAFGRAEEILKREFGL